MTKRKKQTRGRPSTAGSVRIVPIPHEQPDPRKLGRAFLALALHQSSLEAEAQRTPTRPVEAEANDERQ